MKKLIVLVLLLGVASSAWASTDWLTSAASDNWFTVGNWGSGVPNVTLTTNARTFQTNMNTTYMPRIATSQPGYVAATCYQLEVGGGSHATVGGTGKFTMDSGSLTITDYFRSGASSTSNRWGAIYMNGGTITVGGKFSVGLGSSTIDVRGWLYMTGGTINSTGTAANGFIIGSAPGASGTANISGGTINCANFIMKENAGTGTVSLNLSGSGKVIIAGDKTALVQQYKDNGWINDEVQYDYNVSNAGKTTLFVPEPATLCLLGFGALSLIRRKK